MIGILAWHSHTLHTLHTLHTHRRCGVKWGNWQRRNEPKFSVWRFIYSSTRILDVFQVNFGQFRLFFNQFLVVVPTKLGLFKPIIFGQFQLVFSVVFFFLVSFSRFFNDLVLFLVNFGRISQPNLDPFKPIIFSSILADSIQSEGNFSMIFRLNLSSIEPTVLSVTFGQFWVDSQLISWLRIPPFELRSILVVFWRLSNSFK